MLGRRGGRCAYVPIVMMLVNLLAGQGCQSMDRYTTICVADVWRPGIYDAAARLLSP